MLSFPRRVYVIHLLVSRRTRLRRAPLCLAAELAEGDASLLPRPGP